MDASGITQAEIEWLRCLHVAGRMNPVLPMDIQRKLEERQLLESKADRVVLTDSGRQLLHTR